MLVLDTDHLSILQYDESPTAIELANRLADAGEFDVVTTVISYEEQARSWLALIRRYSDVARQTQYYHHLVEFADFFAQWHLLTFDERAAEPLQAIPVPADSHQHQRPENRVDRSVPRRDVALTQLAGFPASTGLES